MASKAGSYRAKSYDRYAAPASPDGVTTTAFTTDDTADPITLAFEYLDMYMRT
jgi:hypothetical protein